MKILLLLVSFVVSICGVGQSIDSAFQLLRNRKLEPLIEFIDHSRSGFVDLDLFRDVIPGYREGVLRVAEPKGRIQCSSYITFLSTDQTIFYYKSERGCLKDTLGKLNFFGSLTDSFTNKEEYNRFETAFTAAYGTSIDKNDLFQNSIVFGSFCGIAGLPPEYAEKLDSLIKTRDIRSIRAWLRSPNSEKQLYAIEGFKRLEKEFYHLAPNDRRVIEILKKKQGKVKVCSGCIGSLHEFKDVLASLDNPQVQGSRRQSANEIIPALIYAIIAILLLVLSTEPMDKMNE